MPSLNQELASLLTDDSGVKKIKSDGVTASTSDVGVSGATNNNSILKIADGITIGEVTESYTMSLVWGVYPQADWTDGYLQNADNPSEWGLYVQLAPQAGYSSDVYGNVANGFQGVGTNWLQGASTSTPTTRNVNVFTPIRNLETGSGTDLTGLSNQTFLDNAVNGVKDSAPLAFDTLGEIATALPTNENASAFINLNTGTRVHTIVGDGSTTEFAISHTSGNIDVFKDGVLQVPKLSDSANGATSVLANHNYYSSDGTQGMIWTWSTYVGTDQVQFGYDPGAGSAGDDGNKWEWWSGWSGWIASNLSWQSTYTWGIYRDPTVHPDNITDFGDMAQDWLFDANIYQSGSYAGPQTRQGNVSNVQGRDMNDMTIRVMMPVDPVHYLLMNPSQTVGGPMVSQDTSGQSSSHVVFSIAPEANQVITIKTY